MRGIAEYLRQFERSDRVMKLPTLTPQEIEQLLQLRIVTWDGNVMDKMARGRLHTEGLITRWNGYQVITRDGMAVLETLGLINQPQEIAGNIFRQ